MPPTQGVALESGLRVYTPDEVQDCRPEQCSCGCKDFVDEHPIFVHQWNDLLPMLVNVRHFQVLEGKCCNCGKSVKGRLPAEHTKGFGPLLTSLVGVLFSTTGASARQIEDFFSSGLFVTNAGESIKVSLGSVMELRDRCSRSLIPHYEAIQDIARVAPINHIDETSWPTFGPEGKHKNWLWVMRSNFVSLFKIDPHRSREAFNALIGDWKGFLISDDYALYRRWDEEKRQACLAHLIRAAKKHSEDPDPDLAKWGTRLLKELRRLSQMSKKAPTCGEWQAWVMRMKRLFRSLTGRKDSLGNLARRLEKFFVSLYTFLRVLGVKSTNNDVERDVRPVVRRKISYGSTDERGLRWTERIYSVLKTCMANSWSFVDLLQGAVTSFLSHKPQDLSRYSELKRQAIEARVQLGLDPATP